VLGRRTWVHHQRRYVYEALPVRGLQCPRAQHFDGQLGPVQEINGVEHCLVGVGTDYDKPGTAISGGRPPKRHGVQELGEVAREPTEAPLVLRGELPSRHSASRPGMSQGSEQRDVIQVPHHLDHQRHPGGVERDQGGLFHPVAGDHRENGLAHQTVQRGKHLFRAGRGFLPIAARRELATRRKLTARRRRRFVSGQGDLKERHCVPSHSSRLPIILPRKPPKQKP
jgi:hypothetical protein